jgi:ribosomal protein S18 acetylase RimI-like enzyme
MESPGERVVPLEIVLRHAIVSDAPEIVRLHVRVWQWAYRGQIPDEYLDALDDSLPRREAFRRDSLSRSPRPFETWVAELNGAIAAFADIGPSRDDDASPHTGELYSIHVDGTLARQGIGRALMARALDELRDEGFTEVTLWVLDTNVRARTFYEALGWCTDGAMKSDPRPGFELHEVRYRRSLA